MSAERSKRAMVTSGGPGRPIQALPGVLGVPEPSTAVQTLIIPDFPSVDIARTLSPNGRAHWVARQKAKESVAEAVWAAWVSRQDELRPMPPPVHVTYRWIVPDRRHRDLDNHGTGVVKVVQDTLVRLKLLPGGDHSTALTSTVEIVYEKHQRRLEVQIASIIAVGGG